MNIGAPELVPFIQNPTALWALQSCGTHVSPSGVKLSMTTAHDEVSRPISSASLSSVVPGTVASGWRAKVGMLLEPATANHPSGGTAAESPRISSDSKSSTMTPGSLGPVGVPASSSRIVTVVTSVPSVAPAALDSDTVKVRLPSARSLPVVGTVMLAVVSPAGIVTVPEAAV